MKHFLKITFNKDLPLEIATRRDKMGFPVPLKEWFSNDLRDFIFDVFQTQKSRSRRYFNSDAILANFDKSERFSRKVWGLLSLELWHQQFHDKAAKYKHMLRERPPLIAAQ
jgi:asparagine synthase (glutamine-hydrolysing)